MSERLTIGTLVAISIAAALWIGLQDPEPELRPADALIGYGCGPDKETMVAREEDMFPKCDRIIVNHAIPGEK